MERLHLRLLHTMYRDPCRRFTLGATVDGTCIRLWIYNRSMLIASESFDFIKVSVLARIITQQLSGITTGTENIDKINTFIGIRRRV